MAGDGSHRGVGGGGGCVARASSSGSSVDVSLRYEGACQKHLEHQQWLQQVEAENNELTLLVEALRAEKHVLEQRPLGCEDV